MKKYSFAVIAVILSLALLAGCSAATSAVSSDNTGNSEVNELTDASETLSLDDFTPNVSLDSASGELQFALMVTDADGNFYPEYEVSRADFCIVLATVLKDLPQGECPYEDIEKDSSVYSAVSSLFAAGLLPWSIDYPLQPDASVTLDETALILQRVSLSMSSEEDSSRISLLASEFSGAALLTRAQLAYIGVTVLGVEPLEGALIADQCLPADVMPGEPYWAYIAQAVCVGEPEIPEDGVYRAYGSLYGVWEHGTLIKDLDYGVWTFGSDGRYTTGDSELDGYLEEAMQASGAADLEGEEALQAAYLYVKYNFDYVVTPADMQTIDTGVTGWEYERALRFFQYGGGTCYGFAAVFGLMARMLGENAYIVAATINQYDWPHGFVVIPEDGIDWIYDPELEATRQDRHADLELFHIQNDTIYYYWYEPDW